MHIALGVTGSIAAYKSLTLMRLLIKAGHTIQVLLTSTATQFITPDAITAITGTPPCMPTDYWDHMRCTPDCLLVAPATANSMAAYAHGSTPDPIARFALAFTGPKFLAPAMHSAMWAHPATQRNLAQLIADGWQILGPDTGALSGDDSGIGRFVDPAFIVLALDSVHAWRKVAPKITLAGHTLLLTAGGTTEALDSVRVITNRSTGMWGEIIAHVASLLGAQVIMLSSQPPRYHNPAIQWHRFQTVSDLSTQLRQYITQATHLYMMAAVSDFLPPAYTGKYPREPLTLTLEPSPDILAGLDSPGIRRIGFCLSCEQDTQLALELAEQKRVKKRCDAIILNHADSIGKLERSFHILTETHRHAYTAPLIQASIHMLMQTI